MKRRRRCRKKPRALRFLLDGLSPGRLSPCTLSFTSLGCRRQLLLVPREQLGLPHDFLRVLEASCPGANRDDPGSPSCRRHLLPTQLEQRRTTRDVPSGQDDFQQSASPKLPPIWAQAHMIGPSSINNSLHHQFPDCEWRIEPLNVLCTVPILRICIQHMIFKLIIVPLTIHVLPGQIGHARQFHHPCHNLLHVLLPQPVILSLGHLANC